MHPEGVAVPVKFTVRGAVPEEGEATAVQVTEHWVEPPLSHTPRPCVAARSFLVTGLNWRAWTETMGMFPVASVQELPVHTASFW